MSPPLPVVSGKETIAALQKSGFLIVGQKGSHVKLQHFNGNIVIIPNHKELASGTLRSIIRQSGLSVEHFCNLIKTL